MCDHTFVNPATGQLNMFFVLFSLSPFALEIWSRETGSAVPSRASPLIFHIQAKFGAYLRDSSSRFP